nr:uncharacterized protein LOC106688297 isoform X2 [Halyomorpha halys]
MFFDKGNCRAVRLLHEASDFLEACLEKLLALEQEALSELNETISNKNKSCDSLNEISKKNGSVIINFRPSSSSPIADIVESTCLQNLEYCENKSPCVENKIRLLNLDKLLPATSKRKHEVALNENNKKSKCDQTICHSDEEMPENNIFDINQLNVKNDDKILEHTSESRIPDIKNCCTKQLKN